MKFHEIECIGRFLLQRVPTLPTWTIDDVGRMIHVETEDNVYYGGTADYGAWINVSEHFIDSGAALDPSDLSNFANRQYVMKIVNGNIRLYY